MDTIDPDLGSRETDVRVVDRGRPQRCDGATVRRCENEEMSAAVTSRFRAPRASEQPNRSTDDDGRRPTRDV